MGPWSWPEKKLTRKRAIMLEEEKTVTPDKERRKRTKKYNP